MARIEILDAQGIVINTIVADEDAAERIHPGRWRLAADQPGPPYLGTIITPGAFSNRFTDDEWIALDIKSQHDKAAPPAAQALSAAIRRAKDSLALRRQVDLSLEETQNRVLSMCQILESEGVILDAAARAAEILNNPVQPDEVP